MKKHKICVYAICKNEEHFAERWMRAMGEADMVVVTDTGSNDATVKKLQDAGALVYQRKIDPWRFDVARNIAMDYVPEDMDICVCCDLDEIFEPGWRQKLDDAWSDDCTRAKYLFTWSHHPDGSPAKQFPMEKIHRRQGFRWVHPVHEVLEYSGVGEDKTVWIDGLVLHHYPDLSKSRNQYLPLLELSARENPLNDRVLFWLGREYMYHGKHDLCIETLKKHLSLPSALWNEERSASMRCIGTSYNAQGNRQEAKSWFFRAVAECPIVREPYLSLAKTGYEEANWPLVYAMVQKGLAIKYKSGSYLLDSESWGYMFYDLGAISAYHLGLYETAQDYAIKALAFDSGNERLKSNLRLIKTKISEAAGKGDEFYENQTCG